MVYKRSRTSEQNLPLQHYVEYPLALDLVKWVSLIHIYFVRFKAQHNYTLITDECKFLNF